MKSRFVVLGLLLTSIAGVAMGANVVTRSVLSNGAFSGSSAHHAVRSTLGQTVTGSASSAHHSMHAGFWWPGQSTSEIAENAGLPTSFALRSVSPNPFSRSTEIRFDVPASGGRLSLRVFDVNGRAVRTFVQGDASPGAQRLVWDGSDDAGHRLGVGVYILSFDAPGRKATRKLVLLP